ncbi:LytR cell envelope-related transcriptional attenuator [Geodermatophilus normandii]|uniref:LytR cell envelope-related transcriptional attenuator n=1 Tax=Geodermatophilus normandii TaxID=1137989 RepID=A0A317QFK3_9ACTN|nr:LytR C-terminal domain-containing protein [Geodermatophilus normandii]PWW21534.1 LytR cell envelope-related transcriptional attenuator [Geodermatophilus normandii]
MKPATVRAPAGRFSVRRPAPAEPPTAHSPVVARPAPQPPAPQPPARPAAPATTVAPFQAVPTPQADSAEPAAPPLDPWDQPARPPARNRARTPEAAPAPPAAPPTEAIPDREVVRDRGASRAPAAPPTEAIPDREPVRGVVAAPLTEAIPDRALSSRSRTQDDRDDREAGPDVDTGATGVVGNRAAMRAERAAREAERQAMEVERRKAARRAGVSRAALRAADGEDAPPRRRRGLALLAVVVVALVVLGVYSFASPAARETGSTAPGTQTSAPASVAPSTAPLPPLSAEPLPPVEEAPGTPVRVPVTVLNATPTSGLAAEVAAAFDAQGWSSAGVGAYEGGDVASTTVYFDAGNEEQRLSALQLMDAFPGITTGPAARFFDVPGVPDPGLVVVVTGELQP